jgi:hypothetical protein
VTDIASLAIKIDATQAASGAQALDKLATSGAKAEAATERLGAAAVETGGELRGMASAANDVDKSLALAMRGQSGLTMAHTAATKAAKLHGHEMLNLSRQFADIGVTAAMGMNPLMIMVQQGPQIAETFALASKRGLTFSMVLRQIAASAWAAIAPLAPFIAAAAGMAAVIGGGFAIAAQQINKGAGDLTAGLGLTEKQLDKVKEKSVTMGDVVQATFQVLGQRIVGLIGPQLEAVGKLFGDIYQAVVNGANWAAGSFIGAWVGSFNAIGAVWKAFPGVIGEAVIGAANLAIGAVEQMVNTAIDRINLLIRTANAAAKLAGAQGQLPTLGAAALPRLANPYAGSASQAASAVASEFTKGLEQGRKAWADFERDTSAAAQKIRIAKILKEAGDAAKGAKAEIEKARDAAMSYLAGLQQQLAELGKTPEQILLMRAANEAAKAPTKALGDEIRTTAAALAELTTRTRLLAETADPAVKTQADLAEKLAFLRSEVEAGKRSFDDYIAAKSRALNQALPAGTKGQYVDLQFIGEVTKPAALPEISMQTFRDKVQKPFNDAVDQMETSATAKFLNIADSVDQIRYAFEDTIFALRNGDWSNAARGIINAYKAIGEAFRTSGLAGGIAATATAAGSVIGGTVGSALSGAGTGFIAGGPVGAVIGGGLGLLSGLVGAAEKHAQAALLAAQAAVDALQKSQGTGSVLGDLTAQSNSIANSLATSTKYQASTLGFSDQMTRSLKSIDANITGLTGLLARQLSASTGIFDTSGLGLGSTSSKGGIGGAIAGMIFSPVGAIVGALMKKTVTTTLQDQGLSFGQQTVGDLVAGGVQGNTYQDVTQQTKKSLFGVTLSSKTKNITTTGALDDDLGKQIQLIVGSLRDGILGAATVLGVEGAEAAINAFSVDLGKISLKDMSGEEMQAALNAVFSKLGDDMATAALPVIAEFQKVGEGSLETLVRLATDYQMVDAVLGSVGKTFGAVGLASLAARENLVGLFDSLDDFASKTSFFAQNFLSEAERLAPVQAAVTKELDRLGLQGIATKEQFKDLVLGLDVSTAAGAGLYAQLMTLAPAFAAVADAANDNLAGQWDWLSGTISSLYGSLRDEVEQTRDRFQGFADTLSAFRQSLDVGAAAQLSPEAAYFAAKTQFQTTSAAAAGGDETALGELTGVSQAYLAASKDYYASSQGYFDDFAAVKSAVEAAEDYARAQVSNAQQQLRALDEMVDGLGLVKGSVDDVQFGIAGLAQLIATANNLATVKDPQWGALQNVAVNKQLAQATGYTGIFGNNAWQNWIVQQSDPLKDIARYILTQAGQIDRIVGFADGGYHAGGLRVVGERGPELEATGPARYWNNAQTRSMLGGSNDNSELARLMREVRDELRAANRQRGAAATATLEKLDQAIGATKRVKSEVRRQAAA